MMNLQMQDVRILQNIIAAITLLLLQQPVYSICSDCYKRLGDDNSVVSLTCDTTGRTSPQVNWFRDDTLLHIDERKYALNYGRNRLTIRHIVASDEGNYTCSYNAGSIQKYGTAGCLIVYGKALFASCELTDSRCMDDLTVSNTGVITFDLRITYHGSGNAGLTQTFARTVITKSSNVLFSIYGSTTDSGDRTWTVEGNTAEARIAKLHNALDTDRGEYTITTEVNDLETGSLSRITKQAFVTALECTSPPTLKNGSVTTSGLIISSVAQYICDDGYTLTGSNNLVCIQRDQDAIWNGEAPHCTRNIMRTQEMLMFQLQVGPNEDCTRWNDDKSTRFLAALKDQISMGIESNCNYSYSSSHITELRILCSQYPKYVTIRGFLSGTENNTSDEILNIVEKWHLMPSTTILTDNRLLSINRNCSVSIEDWSDMECKPPPRVQPCQCNYT